MIKLDREQARQYIIENARSFLEPDKSGRGYVCPICDSGSGSKGTGITTKDGTHFTCWAGCFTHADYIDIIGKREGLTDYPAKLAAACREAGITIDDHTYRPGKEKGQKKMEKKRTQEQSSSAQQEEDYTSYFRQCHLRIGGTDYPQRRGLGQAVIDRFNLGYDPEWKNPKRQSVSATPRLIIPTSSGSYLARDTRANIPEKQQQYSKMKVGKVHLFNLNALELGRPSFVVEGEIDALSIIEVGGNALALGSTSNAEKLVKIFEANKPQQPVIISMDNDEAGRKASETLAEGLARLGIPFYRENPCGGYKDANEALQRDRESFCAAIVQIEARVSAERDKEKEAAAEEYRQTSAAAYLQQFMNGISENARTPCMPTGFDTLDKVLDGGLYEGLYCVGAISSLGKTSLILQLADQVAARGRDVLIFSLEMARTQLMSKSISRQTLLLSMAQKKGMKLAKTARGITDGKRYANYSKEELAIINNAVRNYGEYAKNIYIVEGIGDIGVTQLREHVEKHILLTGNRPLVICDYLQILAPYNDKASDKQNTDKAVLELKRISRDCKLPLIAISAFNRENYRNAVGMSAFKESGAIEYGCDVLIGLQLEGAGSRDFDEMKAKATKDKPRKIELVILKNRDAAVGDKVAFDYYPMFNYFAEKGLAN